jgi:protein-serine/threonine kinase
LLIETSQYAMLAGYLPFDDDPANPEGDNINLLYKYIVSTPLTFPEYVTPHARDLLRRILVPDPRKRADLFEVARHSWLSEYAHVVGFITSSTTTPGDIQNTTISDERSDGAPLLARSASVREPTKTSKAPAVGGLASKHGNIDPDTPDSHSKSVRDNKRNTIQLEYTEPRQQTVRGQDVPVPTSSSSRIRAGGPSAVDGAPAARRTASTEKPLPSAPVTSSRDPAYQSSKETKRPPVSANNRHITAPARPGKEPPRSASENTFMSTGPTIARPNTGGSMASSGSMNLVQYSQPAAPTVAGTNAHGRISQPTNGKNYISNPIPHDERDSGYGRPSVSQAPSKFARISGMDSNSQPEVRGHKRSSTVSSMGEKLFGRHVSLFGRSNLEKPKKSYPPVSLSNANIGGGDSSRQSMDSSRRSISFGFGKKRSGSITGSTGGGSAQERSTRRFSLIPSGFSLKAIGIGKNEEPAPVHISDDRYYEQGDDVAYSEPPKSNPKIRPSTTGRDSPLQQTPTARATPPQHQRYASQSQSQGYDGSSGSEYARNYRPAQAQTSQPEKEQYYANKPPTQLAQSATQYPQYNDYEPENRRQTQNNAASRMTRGGVLQKPNRRFTEAYEQEGENAFGGNVVNTSGSTGAARKVMDFFRRRGRAREEA